MRPASRPRRFLLRASALAIAMLVLWWFALQVPLLFALRAAARIPLALANATIAVDASGGWSFHVPVTDSPPEVPRPAGSPQRIESVDFTVPAADITALTLALPLYWAVALAIPGRPRPAVLLKGSILQLAIATVSLVLFAEVSAYKVLAGLRPDSTALARWARELTSYLVTGVIPYASPLIAAVWLHPEFRSQIFTREPDR